MTLFSNVPSADSVADADYVLGLQGSTGPGTGNTAKMTLQQIVNLVGTGPLASLSVTGNASIGGALTLSGNPTTALQAATKQYADLMLPLAGGTMTGTLTLPQATFSKQLSVSGTAGAASNMWLNTGPHAFGTMAAASDKNYLNVVGAVDEVNLTGSGSLALFQIQHTLGGTSTRTNGRNTFVVETNVSTAPASSSNYNVVGTFLNTFAQTNVGGSGGSPQGSLWGINSVTRMATGSTNWRAIWGWELDISVEGTASTTTKVGLGIINLSADVSRGSVYDAGIGFGGQPPYNVSQATWKYGIAFGTTFSVFPFTSDSSLITVVPQLNGSTQPAATALYGVDFSWLSIASGGAGFKQPGFYTGSTGNVHVGSNRLSWSSTGLTIDAGGSTGSISSVAANGSGYIAGDIVSTGNGDIYRVTLSGSGITALTPIRTAVVYGSAPSNPVTIIGGSGSGATVNMTWTAASELDLNPSGDTVVGKGSAGATTDTSGFLMVPFVSGTPTGVPINASKGIAMRYDTSANKLWIYNSGWKSATFA